MNRNQRFFAGFVIFMVCVLAIAAISSRNDHPTPNPTTSDQDSTPVTNRVPVAIPATSHELAVDESALDVPIPSFKVTHQESGFITIVVDKSASDVALKRLIWQLRTAAHERQFNAMKISQTLVDERDPTIFFYIYKGSRCSEENRSKGAVTCGQHMHDAAFFLLGSFASRDSEAANLYHGDEETRAEQLFGPGRPAPTTFSEFVSAKGETEDDEPVLSKPADLLQKFNRSVWAGGRKAVFGTDSESPERLVVTADWLVSSDNTQLMKMGLMSRREEACSAGFSEIYVRPFVTDKGTLFSFHCKRN